MSAQWSVVSGQSRRNRRRCARSLHARPAFTLTEILIVIAIIVLLIALAVPAFSLITGGKSIEGATNQLSAALGRARAEAIGLQKITGVMFVIEPRSQRVNIAIVTAADSIPAQIGDDNALGAPSPEVWLDLADADFIPLPVGVSAQTISDSSNTAAPDRYLGFNIRAMTATGTTNEIKPVGGVILFDGSGRLISVRYGFKCLNIDNNTESRMGSLLKPTTVTDVIPGNKATPIRSQFGLVMFERDPFASQNFNETDPLADQSNYATTESKEELWLDENATPILINRYTGTLVKGE